MAKSSTSIVTKIQAAVVVLMVTLLSLVFLLEFGGPQAKGCAQGHGGKYVAKVEGHVITEGDFDATYALAGFSQAPLEMQKARHFKEIVLEGLIERTLLAGEARRMGFHVSDEDVWRHLSEDGTVDLWLGVDAPPDMPQGKKAVPVLDEKGNFDADAAKRFIQYYLRRTVGEFGEMQAEETLAARARAVIRSTVSVSPAEVWNAYQRERDRVNLAYVRFSPSYYRDRVQPNDAELQKWMSAHADELEHEYQANKSRYTDLPKEVHAEHILIRVPSDADDATRAKKLKEAQGLLAKIHAGADFADLARKYSEDPGSAERGGDLGWSPKGRNVAAFDKAMFALEPGQVSGVVKTQFGYHIIKVLGVREGDVPEKEAKHEIAERLYREDQAQGLARSAAVKALTELRKGTSLDDLDAELAGRAPGTKPPADEDDHRDPGAPKVTKTGPFGRGQNPLPAGLDAGPLIKAAFDHDPKNPLPSKPVQIGHDWFVFKVLERTKAKRKDFTADERQQLYTELHDSKARETLRIYVERLKAKAQDDDAIKIDKSVLTYEDEAS